MSLDHIWGNHPKIYMIREAWILSLFLCARTKLTMWAGNSQFTMLSKSEQKYAWMKRFCHCSWPRSDPSPCLASFVTPQSTSTKFRGDENLTWKQIDLFCNIILGPLSGATNCRTALNFVLVTTSIYAEIYVCLFIYIFTINFIIKSYFDLLSLSD